MNTLPVESPANVQIVIENLDSVELNKDEIQQLLKSGKVSLQCSLKAPTDENVIIQVDNVKVWR